MRQQMREDKRTDETLHFWETYISFYILLFWTAYTNFCHSITLKGCKIKCYAIDDIHTFKFTSLRLKTTFNKWYQIHGRSINRD